MKVLQRTVPVDDHIKKRWLLNPVSGESETIMRTVPRTQMIKSYFSAACAIDVHNHLRQDGRKPKIGGFVCFALNWA